MYVKHGDIYARKWHEEFYLQVKQKQESMEVAKDRQGAAGRDMDSIRAAILEEAVIVCKFVLFLISCEKLDISFLSVTYVRLAGLFYS